MQQAPPKLLVLDGQGVVFNAPIKRFLRQFATGNEIDYDTVIRRWAGGLREKAWRGLITDEQLWDGLAGREIDTAQTMRLLRDSYTPGLAHAHLAAWSKLVPIWLLSNHRAEWLKPHLEATSATSAFDKLLISDVTGHIKPETRAFTQLLDADLAATDILFVDDQPHNVRAAQRIGLRTSLAAPSQPWVAQVAAALLATKQS